MTGARVHGCSPKKSYAKEFEIFLKISVIEYFLVKLLKISFKVSNKDALKILSVS